MIIIIDKDHIVCTAAVNEKKSWSSFYCLHYSSDGMALVTILLQFPCTRVHSQFISKNAVGQIACLAEPEIRALKL